MDPNSKVLSSVSCRIARELDNFHLHVLSIIINELKKLIHSGMDPNSQQLVVRIVGNSIS
jgi:hypothetical protein